MATTKANELSQFAKTLTVDASGNTTLTGNITAPSIANAGGGTFVDSDTVVSLVDSDHVQARAHSTYIKGIVDSDYIKTVTANDSATVGGLLIKGHVKVDANEAYDLGDSDNRFRDLYLSGETINMAGTRIKIDSSGDLEIRDFANDFKRIKAKEIEFDDEDKDATFKTVLRKGSTSGKMEFVKVRRSDGVELTDDSDKQSLDLSGTTTDELREGDNRLYFTNARADARISAASITDLSDANQTVRTTDDVSFGTVTLTGTLDGPSTFYIDRAPIDSDAGLLVIRGDLQVDGTTTTVNSETVTINDKNIVLADSASNASEADGAGITVNGASATIQYDASNDEWDFNKPINIPGGTTTGNVSFGDNDKAIFGAGSDLQIFHDGGNSLIQDAGTGDLILKSNGTATVIKTNAGNNLISARDAGGVGIFYDGSEKLTTTNTGVDVTGSMTTSGDVIVGGSSGGRLVLEGLAINDYQTLSNPSIYRTGSGGSGIFASAGNLVVQPRTNISRSVNIATSNDGTNTYTRAKFAGNGDISFYDSTGTTQGLYWDASTQRLGLGTTSPSNALTIQSSGSDFATMRLEAPSNTTPANFQIRAHDGVFDIRDANNSATRMTINSSGNVGIGTASPSANTKLDVNGAARIGNSTDGIMIENNSGAFDISNAAYIRRNSSSGALELTSGSTTARNMIFNTGTNGAESMRIDSSGNVGIGTTSPSEKLHVSGNIKTTGTIEQSYDDVVWSHTEATHRPLSRKTYSEAGSVGTTGSNITDVYGEADLSAIDNNETFTYSAAWAAVETHGGRLPTLAEVMDGVGRGSGQGYDSYFIWTCTPAGPHHVWVAHGAYDGTSERKIVDITDSNEVYRTRCFFDVDRANRQVSYDNDGELRVKNNLVATTGKAVVMAMLFG